MKTIFLFSALLASPTAPAQVPPLPAFTLVASADQNPQEPISEKEAAKRARKARRQTGPEVYRGTVSKQRSIIDDARGAHKDAEPTDDEEVDKDALRPSKHVKTIPDK